MMNSTMQKSSLSKAAIVLGLVIIAAYSPVIFLGQSYDQSWPMSPPFLGYTVGKPIQFAPTIDPAADYEQNWPILKLATKLFSEGILPLWDPYIGAGQPLAADTINYIYSPLILGFSFQSSFGILPF